VDPLADEIALELGEASHDGPHQLAAGRAKVKAQASLRKNAHLPAVEIIERLHEVLGASSPARQLGNEDGVDLSRLGEDHSLLTLKAVVLRPRGGLLEDGYYPVPAAFGERPQVPFLALARLVIGADAAVDRDVSQLNPLQSAPLRT